MNAYHFEVTARDQPYRLVLAQRAALQPGEGQIVVRVRATSLNYRDLLMRDRAAGREVAGRIPLSDGAGEISAVGAGVTAWKLGDRVCGCFFQGWREGPFQMGYHQADLGGSLDGMLAEEVLLSAEGVVAAPPHLSYEEAACLPCAGLTAWYAITARGQFKSGDWLLTLGTGGVSIFSLQIAVALGGRVVITSSSDEKLARARAMGATHTINYRTQPQWEKEVWRLTEKRGVDHVMEVGGPGTLEKSLQCVAAGGQIALIGVLTGFGAPQTSLFPLVARNARLNGIYVGPRDEFARMNSFLHDRQIQPVIDRVFPFAEAPAAFDYLRGGQHLGKVVIAHR